MHPKQNLINKENESILKFLLYLGLRKSDVIIIERLTKKGLRWIKALSETKKN